MFAVGCISGPGESRGFLTQIKLCPDVSIIIISKLGCRIVCFFDASLRTVAYVGRCPVISNRR